MRDELRNFVVQNFLFGAHGASLRDDDSFLEKGIIDSTGVLELVSFLEERYQIKMEDHELIPENLDSIDRIVAYAGRKLADKTEEKFAAAAVPRN